ncbi:YpdA family putative bacillithiol disulfide reductase [Flavobacterium silvaticum]|uniref:YpdA family putative bacillithiol disulfide reductase n=1 Tax=Flavobacterium silvaticum TaxID=1852020 RepID=A0A972JHY5_9FLAO|nr:YpdA family putative bacillithiol disulfide reductase [Flavobacterium silvaticum]NMH27628.1 YpdA family putative bacillithiol disulfide reductase [Flavobacterium silvaticum]
MAVDFDLIIIGAGPIGMSCGIEAQKAGLTFTILEKGSLTDSLYRYPLHMTFFSTAERLEIGGIPFNCISPKPGRQEALEYYRNVQRYFNLDIQLYAKVDSVQKSNDVFEVQSAGKTFRSRFVIVATGFYDIPIYLNVPGENLPILTHYFKEAHPYAFEDIVVIGANNSAVDAALECWRKGANVTMVIRKSEINDRVKYWVKPDIENRIAEGSIKAYFNSSVTEIFPDGLELKDETGMHRLKAKHILALTGYQPDFSFLKKSGVTLSDDMEQIPNYNADTMESNVNGLYLAGVVCGGMQTHKWFIENSREHASQIIGHIKTQLS